MSIAEKLTAVAENEQKVYEAGKAAQEQAFWDMYQDNGNRANYERAFGGNGWTVQTFKPKYDIVPTSNSVQMFRTSGLSGDLVQILESLAITLDLSKAIRVDEVFMSSKFTRIGVVSCLSAISLQNMFSGATVLATIDNLILKDDGTNTFISTFRLCSALENITIEGVIGNNIDFSPCTKLTHDSLMSIINALQTKSSGSFVLTLGTENLAKLTDAEKAIATERGWTLA